MKLVNLLVATALVAGTLIVSAPADAQRHGRHYGWNHRGPGYYRGGYGYRYRPHYRPYRYGYRPYGYRHYAYRHRYYR